ncbi:hypothetical protein HELRODRAFT_160674 [Helobdella robusta]|uniref:Uncharacterized protein n=1 Tax=Helobdella robusta TaxID=6412 RepID=T1EQL1_HELRO|nr:hypothetical protein HELRODRAFT_160674 [Helobdella robusta]ESO06498.1 hypothetical protein HELRODRAFT_160674 [Helobdella robusta]
MEKTRNIECSHFIDKSDNFPVNCGNHKAGSVPNPNQDQIPMFENSTVVEYSCDSLDGSIFYKIHAIPIPVMRSPVCSVTEYYDENIAQFVCMVKYPNYQSYTVAMQMDEQTFLCKGKKDDNLQSTSVCIPIQYTTFKFNKTFYFIESKLTIKYKYQLYQHGCSGTEMKNCKLEYKEYTHPVTNLKPPEPEIVGELKRKLCDEVECKSKINNTETVQFDFMSDLAHEKCGSRNFLILRERGRNALTCTTTIQIILSDMFKTIAVENDTCFLLDSKSYSNTSQKNVDVDVDVKGDALSNCPPCADKKKTHAVESNLVPVDTVVNTVFGIVGVLFTTMILCGLMMSARNKMRTSLADESETVQDIISQTSGQ